MFDARHATSPVRRLVRQARREIADREARGLRGVAGRVAPYALGGVLDVADLAVRVDAGVPLVDVHVGLLVLHAVRARHAELELVRIVADPIRQPDRSGGPLVLVGLVVEAEALAHVRAVGHGDVRDEAPVEPLRARLEPDRVAAHVAAHQRRRDGRAVGRFLDAVLVADDRVELAGLEREVHVLEVRLPLGVGELHVDVVAEEQAVGIVDVAAAWQEVDEGRDREVVVDARVHVERRGVHEEARLRVDRVQRDGARRAGGRGLAARVDRDRQRIAEEDPRRGVRVLRVVDRGGVGAQAGAVAADGEPADVEVAGDARLQRGQRGHLLLEIVDLILERVDVVAQRLVLVRDLLEIVGAHRGRRRRLIRRRRRRLIGRGLRVGRGRGRRRRCRCRRGGRLREQGPRDRPQAEAEHRDDDTGYGVCVSCNRAGSIGSPVSVMRNATRSSSSCADRPKSTMRGSLVYALCPPPWS